MDHEEEEEEDEEEDDQGWKDANFEEYWGEFNETKKRHYQHRRYKNGNEQVRDEEGTGSLRHRSSFQLAGKSSEIKVMDLFNKGLIQVKDILVYEKYFDVLGKSIRQKYQLKGIDPQTHFLHTVALPSYEPCVFSGLNHLENCVFKAFASKGLRKPNGNAWRSVFRIRPGTSSINLFNLRKVYMKLYLSPDDNDNDNDPSPPVVGETMDPPKEQRSHEEDKAQSFATGRPPTKKRKPPPPPPPPRHPVQPGLEPSLHHRSMSTRNKSTRGRGRSSPLPSWSGSESEESSHGHERIQNRKKKRK
ncbi:hypothetical protein HMI56_004020 [Coelomomyces lativittatus]|nr:hypothetical protein HMI56_004020 [Coelomomyces lativittatus]